jgi:hypothetical protein
MPLDLSDRQVTQQRCGQCGREYDRVLIFAKRDGDAYAIANAVCHGHVDPELWLDATFGSWEEPFIDHITMSCKVTTHGAGAVNAIVIGRGEADYYGQRLTRDEALTHPRLPDLWELLDAIVIGVPEAAAAIYGD